MIEGVVGGEPKRPVCVFEIIDDQRQLLKDFHNRDQVMNEE